MYFPRDLSFCRHVTQQTKLCRTLHTHLCSGIPRWAPRSEFVHVYVRFLQISFWVSELFLLIYRCTTRCTILTIVDEALINYFTLFFLWGKDFFVCVFFQLREPKFPRHWSTLYHSYSVSTTTLSEGPHQYLPRRQRSNFSTCEAKNSKHKWSNLTIALRCKDFFLLSAASSFCQDLGRSSLFRCHSNPAIFWVVVISYELVFVSANWQRKEQILTKPISEPKIC